jgi:ligand-binding sensor domain-containing protein
MKWILVIVCCSSLFTMGQSDFAFRNYTLETGLPSNTIYEVYQAQNGQIFIGHEKGCSSFNGLSFKPLVSKDKPTALSNIISLPNGNLMCRNFQGKEFIIKDNRLLTINKEKKTQVGMPTYTQDDAKNYVFYGSTFSSIDTSGRRTAIRGIENVMNQYHRGVVLDNKAYMYGSHSSTGASLLCYNLITNKIESLEQQMQERNIHIFKSRGRVYWIDDNTGECGSYTNHFKIESNLYDQALPKGSKVTALLELESAN